MYSKRSWGGNTDPYILTKFQPPKDPIPDGDDPLVSFVVFEWRDRDLVGKPLNATEDPASELLGMSERTYICDQSNVDAGYCNSTSLGKFILADNAYDVSVPGIVSERVHLKDPKAISYLIKKTGYYCVGTFGFNNEDYQAVVEFREAYGELPAAQIPKLPFYAAITLVYAFLGIGWGMLYYMNRRDILPVQNYITAILVFLVIEMFMTWLFYDFQNRHGLNAGAKALLVVVSVLSAGRNSFSFFLLLIVCMGYGVVKETLGKTMVWVRWLAITHFVFGVLYAVASLSVTPENAGPLILLVVLPLAASLTAFYVWTLNSLNLTMKDLMERKQTVKASMYRKLCWTFAGSNREDFVPNHWQTRWFILDGWLNLVYFFDVAFIAYVWRPTVNNRRFAMSDEIAQEDDGFEIASLGRDSFDEDLEGIPASKAPPAYDAPRTNGGPTTNATRDASPLPAPVPTKPATLPRESLEGETIFAVGEDRFDDSDEDGDEDERKRMIGKG
nr:membrane protein ptm1 [Quercus suber]